MTQEQIISLICDKLPIIMTLFTVIGIFINGNKNIKGIFKMFTNIQKIAEEQKNEPQMLLLKSQLIETAEENRRLREDIKKVRQELTRIYYEDDTNSKE